MFPDFHLTPLECPRCGAALEATEASAIFYCLHCQKGLELRERKYHAYPLHCAPAATSSPVGAIHELPLHYLPFWVIEAQIEIQAHQYTREIPQGDFWPDIFPFLKPAATGANVTTAEEGEAVKLRLFVPAFATTNIAAYTANLGVALTKAQPTFDEGQPVLPEACIYDSQEALTLAEIIFTALEAWESTRLLRLEFNLKPLRQELWALPFYPDKEFLVEPKTGAKMLAAGIERQPIAKGE